MCERKNRHDIDKKEQRFRLRLTAHYMLQSQEQTTNVKIVHLFMVFFRAAAAVVVSIHSVSVFFRLILLYFVQHLHEYV